MQNPKRFRPDPKVRLMDQVRQVLRYHHYAYSTEQTYCDRIMRYSGTLGARHIPGIWVKRRLTPSYRSAVKGHADVKTTEIYTL